ncbi:unnamed protein product [Nippostrongylus brasiliensis]|uniref:CNDH2_C domain-containing protein n=1 Tax=Nippostrongylus brasiliensis TaxID=27835 RepID=A0A0N4XCR1_NIPBR|nr:unnamed protein product [Nippostrongylus brasiliensis]
MLTEATVAEAIEHLEISSVDSTPAKDEEKDDDPFWLLISQEKDDEAHTFSEPPRASHGFGLLPYVTRRKRYKGCVPQPDDFTPDSLRLTPSGCGVLPSRPFTPPIETVPEKDNTTLLCENNEGLEDTVVSESENISVACTWGSDSSTADSPSDSLEETLCHATFRKEFLKQAKLFSEKCKAKNFRIDEVSTIDSFLHRLHDLVSQTNEKFEQIKASSVKHSGDDPDFFSTIFASQPFLNVKRRSNVVDSCFNTFLVYPRQSRETISRKNFDGYVKNMQERLRTKEEFVYFRPQSVCEADTTTTTTASQIASQDGEDEYLVEESCAEANLSNEMPKLFVEAPLSAPQSPDRSFESPPSNALFSEKVDVAEEIPKSDEHDVLLGILTAMDECGGPARSRTALESEAKDDDQTIPPISGCSSQSVSPCEIPSPNLSNGDENQTSCPSLTKSSAKDEASPDSSQEPPARLASPSAIRAFRASLHGDLLPNVNDFPNNIKKPPTDGIKREAVNYGDDPFLYTSTGAVKKPMLRPVKRPKLYSAQAADAEDPYALYVKNESNKSGERPSDPSQAAQYDVFRTTFSSLKDRAACSLAAFNLNKPRSMDKPTQDPSPSGQTENVECGISGNLNAKNFRKVPVRCMSETASAIARPRLLLRPHCRRLSYKPNLMLNWRTQCEWNKQSELDPMEKELIMKNVIPKWGSANPNRTVFPFGKVEGIFWPVVQPHDAIDLNDEDQ